MKFTKHLLAGSLKNKIGKALIFCSLLLAFNSVKAQLLIPFSGSNTLACGTNTVLRDHSNFVLYSNNANGFTVLQAGLNAVINISGNYITEANFDFVRIYSGAGTGGPLLLSVSGTGVINYTGLPGQTLTVQFVSDGSVIMQGFNLNITYTGACFVPCTGAPGANSVVTPTFQICSGQATQISLLNTYTTSGFTYSWSASNVSPVGPFNIPITATNTSFSSGALTAAQTWYQCVITCTNGGAAITTAASAVSVAATVTNTVPYFEGFEGVGVNGRLPNCNWATSNATTVCQTYTIANPNNRLPRTGSSFAAFVFSPAGTDYFYTNAILLNAGVTYSAGLWYTTEATGQTNWSDLSILVGTGQAPATLTSVVSSNGPAASPIHKAFGGTFSVTTTGLYYVAIRATRTSVGANYLSWDDLSVTVPCNLNNPPITITANSTVVCSGNKLTLTASGGDTYQWANNGPAGPVFTVTPFISGVYNVAGTNTLTGCSKTASIQINVNPSPAVSILAQPPTICQGSSSSLMAFGANTYIWGNLNTSNIINVSPQATTIYSVAGTNQFGCVTTATQQVVVNPAPAVTAQASKNTICAGEVVTLTGSGALTYQWISNVVLAQSNPLTISPNASAHYTCLGTDANGCTGQTAIGVGVDACTALSEINADGIIRVYPNPNQGKFVIEMNEGVKTIQVMDVSGRIIVSETTELTKYEMNMTEFASGVYYVKVSVNTSANTLRIIKD